MAERSASGDRLFRVLRGMGFVVAGRVRVGRVLDRVNRGCAEPRVTRAQLDAVLHGGREVSAPLLAALAAGLAIEPGRLLYEAPGVMRAEAARRELPPLERVNGEMPVDDVRLTRAKERRKANRGGWQ